MFPARNCEAVSAYAFVSLMESLYYTSCHFPNVRIIQSLLFSWRNYLTIHPEKALRLTWYQICLMLTYIEEWYRIYVEKNRQ